MEKLNKIQKNSEKAITLISLVVTIIVLLILVGISISMLSGDNSLLQKATDAKEQTEIANIKERAELVKAGLQINTYSGRNSEKIKQNALVSAIHNEFDGSEYKGNKVTTADKRFDIVVDDKLNISVIKHIDMKDDEILIDCELLDYGHGEYAIKVIPSMSDDNIISSYDEWAQAELDKLSTDSTTRQQQLEEIFIKADKWYYCMYNNLEDEQLAEINEITSFVDWMSFLEVDCSTIYDIYESFKGENDNSVEEMLINWEYVKPQEYAELGSTTNTYIITCGEESKTINSLEESYTEFWIYDEGEYNITVTASDGSIGNKTINVKILPKYVTIELETTTSLAENESNETYIWNSSDKSIATVANGIVNGINTGTTYITVTNEEETLISNKCEVKVLESNFDTRYGKIDVIWLSGTSNTYSTTPNVPETSWGTSILTPVYWASNLEGDVSNTHSENIVELKQGDNGFKENNWYNYTIQTGNTDGKTSRWANAYNQEDGSYFVWIPRFAYRITYYSDEYFSNVTGYYDGRGQWNASSGGLRSRIENGIETIEHNGVSYIVHPAFTDCGYDLGSWDEDVTGFWVAKYKMGKEENNNSVWSNVNTSSVAIGKVLTNNTAIRATSKPGVYSWRNIPLGYSYTNGINYNSQMKSHLTKNSEWGAIAYLTHSQYGRNGNEVHINNNSNRITGQGGDMLNAESSTITHTYNTINGMNASSTGNITGIYDVSSITGEWVSAFNETDSTAQYSAMNDESYWTQQTSLTPYSSSTKYATHYFGKSSGIIYSRYNTCVLSTGKTGDATKEVSQGGINFVTDKSTFYSNWNSDCGCVTRKNFCILISKCRIYTTC